MDWGAGGLYAGQLVEDDAILSDIIWGSTAWSLHFRFIIGAYHAIIVSGIIVAVGFALLAVPHYFVAPTGISSSIPL